MSGMIAWHIVLHNKHKDTVYFTRDCDATYVKDSLVNHDHYSPNIKVYRQRLPRGVRQR